MDVQNTCALLERHGVELKKALGQNFLTDEDVCKHIAESCGADKTCGVLEIGPGAGALTRQLAQIAGKVVSLELDTRLLPVLRDSLSGLSNVTVVCGDALAEDIPALVQERILPLRPLVCANLPYQITTPAVLRLLGCRRFQAVCVMVQREAALRLAAAPGSPEYNESSVYCSYYSDPKILFDVPRECFTPRPHVTSAVIRFDTKPQPEGLDEKLYFRIVRAAFGERRKKFATNLSRVLGGERGVWEERLESLGFPRDVRGERLSADDFARLARISPDLLRYPTDGRVPVGGEPSAGGSLSDDI